MSSGPFLPRAFPCQHRNGARHQPQKRSRHGWFRPDSDHLLPIELDVTNAAEAQAAVGTAVSPFGAIDVLVNSAGYDHWAFSRS
jgi:NAD(P)-dependent dehydrogenase (short-subunit alcohol dehydrogenase family)